MARTGTGSGLVEHPLGERSSEEVTFVGSSEAKTGHHMRFAVGHFPHPEYKRDWPRVLVESHLAYLVMLGYENMWIDRWTC